MSTFIRVVFMTLLATFALRANAVELVVPAVANTAGINGTNFQSDLTITNVGPAAGNITIRFIPGAGSAAQPERTVTILGGETLTYRNVLQALWNLSEAGGALSIISDANVVARARTYNRVGDATFGLSLPVIETGSLLSAGQRGDIVWVSQSSEPGSGFRTNFGLTFPAASGGAATVTVYDLAGNAVGSKSYDVASAAFLQETVRNISAITRGRIAVTITRGSALAYTSVVDNVTGDASVFAAEASGITDAIVTGVARLQGLNDTFFQTDFRLVNPNSTRVGAELRLLRAGEDNTNRTPILLWLEAGETREFADVLDSVFGQPAGSSGAIRISSALPLLVGTRTSNLNPENPAAGTFGSQQSAVSVSSFHTAADGQVTLPSVEQTADFRTNVGVSSAASGASLRLELKDSHGALQATTTTTLPPWSWMQTSAVALFGLPQASAISDGSIENGSRIDISVLSGSFAAYSSSVDQRSGDSSVASSIGTSGCPSIAITVSEKVCRTSNATASLPAIPGATYNWTITNGTILSGQGTSSITFSGSAIGSATLNGSVQIGACVRNAARTISIVEAARPSNVKAAAGVTGNPVTLTWSFLTSNGAISEIVITGTDFATPVVLPASAVTYRYAPTAAGAKSATINAKNACGDNTATVSYTVTDANAYGPGSGGTGGPAGTSRYTSSAGREFVVYAPASYSPTQATRVVYALGGQGQTAESVLQMGWSAIAERESVIVVTMTAASSGPGYYGAYDIPEFQTIEEMFERVPQMYNVALKHSYLWGFSAGAHVSYMFGLTAEYSNKVAAMAIQAGAIEAAATRVNPPAWPPQAGARRLPVHLSCGTLDTASGLITAMRRNRDMLLAQNYPVVTREVIGQGHTYTITDVEEAWNSLRAQRLP